MARESNEEQIETGADEFLISLSRYRVHFSVALHRYNHYYLYRLEENAKNSDLGNLDLNESFIAPI